MEMTTNIIPKYGLQKITPVIIHPMIIVQTQNNIPIFPQKKEALEKASFKINYEM
jgi:hypothetical protein